MFSNKMMVRTLLLAFTSSALLAGPALAQEDEPLRNRLSFRFGGGSAGGLDSTLGDLLEDRGFDDTRPGGCIVVIFFPICSSDRPTPDVESAKSVGILAASLRLSSRWSAMVVTDSDGWRTSAFGYQDPGYSVDIAPHVSTIGITAGYSPVPGITASAGPALYRLTTEIDQGSPRTREQSTSKLGLLFDLSLEFPTESRFFGFLFGQYRLSPSATIESFHITTATLGSTPFEEFELPLSHGAFGAGFGIRAF